MLQNFSTTPLLIILTGTVFIALIALTMRSVVRREKAMINAALVDPHEVAAYERRWRSAA